MTREEYENAIQSVHGFDFENNLPTYDGDIGTYQNFMDIKDEYIESLEKKLKKAELAFCVAHRCVNRATFGCRNNCIKMEEFLYTIEEEDD